MLWGKDRAALIWGIPAVLITIRAWCVGVLARAGVGAYLQGDVGLGPDLGGGQFHIGVLAHEVDGDELLAPGAGEAWWAAAGGLLLHHDALGSILALVLVTGAGLQQDHGWGVLTEEPAARGEGGGGGDNQVILAKEPQQRGRSEMGAATGSGSRWGKSVCICKPQLPHSETNQDE